MSNLEIQPKPSAASALSPAGSKPSVDDTHDFNDDDDGVNSDRAHETDRKRSLRSRLKALSPAYTLENSGSVGKPPVTSQGVSLISELPGLFANPWMIAARDHLANERTWLAYLRTSLAIASTGVGRYFRLLLCPSLL